jgi:hypothetical protein
MDDFRLGTDETSIEILKKAFVWYYRVWSYYWNERPSSCVIHPAESFIELPDEVICFKAGQLTENDVSRLQAAFSQPISFIAASLPQDQRGYDLSRRACQNPSPWLERFLAKIATSYQDLRAAVSSGRTQEKDRQEWRFAEAGNFVKYFDGKTERISLTPESGSPYTFTVIKSTSEGLYFTESKKGPVGKPKEQGAYRRHRHEVRKQTSDNLDFFSETTSPVLWHFVQAGRGFKAFVRKGPSTA